MVDMRSTETTNTTKGETMKSQAAQAAQQIRTAIRKTGTDAKGRVRVANTDYTTTLEVNLRGMSQADHDTVSGAINQLDVDSLQFYDLCID